MSQALRVALFVPTADPPDIGDGVVTTNNSNAVKVITTKFLLATGGSGGGAVTEAPSDGTPYLRQDAAWVPLGPIDAGVF